MPGHVTFFSVVLGTAPVGVGSQVTVLGGDLLGFVHSIAGARVAPSVAPGQTKAWPQGLVRKLPPEVQDLLGARIFYGRAHGDDAVANRFSLALRASGPSAG